MSQAVLSPSVCSSGVTSTVCSAPSRTTVSCTGAPPAAWIASLSWVAEVRAVPSIAVITSSASRTPSAGESATASTTTTCAPVS